MAALGSYHSGDASFDTASGTVVKNALGHFGANLADVAYQSFGLGAWLMAGFMTYYGFVRTLTPDPDLERKNLRYRAGFSFLFSLLFAALVSPLGTIIDPATTMAQAVTQSVGGIWGSAVHFLITSVLNFMSLPPSIGEVFAALLLSGAMIYAMNETFAIKMDHYVRLGENLYLLTTRLINGWQGKAELSAARTLAPKTGRDLGALFANLKAFTSKNPAPDHMLTPDGPVSVAPIATPERSPEAVTVAIRTPDIRPVIDDEDADDTPPFVQTRTSKPAAPRPAEKQSAFEFLRPHNFRLPELNILAKPKTRSSAFDEDALRQNARMLESVLAEFGVRGVIDQIRPGPVVTLYELAPAAGVKHARVVALADDIARNMSARSARVAVVQGRNAIGIELPNASRETVFLRDLLASADYEKAGHNLPMALGETIGGEPYIADLSKMPHLLIAGTTGSGKSVGVNAMILSILYRMDPEQCKFIMIDPKMLELSVYDGIPHLLAPVVTDPKKAVVALKWTVKEMEDRYRRMSKIGVRNIASVNERARAAAAEGKNFVRKVQTGFDETGQPIYELDEMVPEPMPFIVVIVDEVADLMMVAGKDIEGAVQRLAQMARAAGIHLIMATQRPSVDVITGTIKANFPTRISFQVTSKIDSRTILGEQGAEQLLGQGDMLYMAGGGRITRLHGPFVADGEVEAVAQFLRDQGTPQYLEDVTAGGDDEGGSGGDMGEGSGSGDELYDKAVYFVTFDRKASTSYIQRKLQIGYNRAASLMEKMELEGVVGPANHVGKRDILVGPPPGH